MDCLQMFYTLITCRTQEGLTVCICFIHLLPAGQKKDGLYVDVLYIYYCKTQEVLTVRCFIHLLSEGHKKDRLYVDVLYTYQDTRWTGYDCMQMFYTLYLQDTRRIDCMYMFYTLITCRTQEDVLYTYYLQDTRRIDCMQMFYTLITCRTQEGWTVKMFYTLITCRTQEGLTVCRCFIHLLSVGHKKDGL